MRASKYREGMEVVHRRRPELGIGVVVDRDIRQALAIKIKWADGRVINHAPSELKRVVRE